MYYLWMEKNQRVFPTEKVLPAAQIAQLTATSIWDFLSSMRRINPHLGNKSLCDAWDLSESYIFSKV